MIAHWNRGAEWHRWDPHIHTPATLLNNQFEGSWDAYFDALENASPTVEALGVTEYGTLRGYKEFLANRAERAPDLKFVFPNVEFRLDVQTEKKRGINLHLLFSPHDPNHVQQIDRVLSLLRYEYKRRWFTCSEEQLQDLGRAAKPDIVDASKALEEGVNQFKVDLKELRALFEREVWLRRNCLVAVAASSGDGTSGLQNDGAFKTMREELEAFASVVFSGNQGDRDFWLGRKAGIDRVSIEKLYGALKPCLHGSDAHDLKKVANPDQDRRCWIRSELTFDGLKQTLLEPESRVHIGPQPPAGPAPSECIDLLEVQGAPWLKAPRIELNNGLVAIIGPKGSGKTALADILAHAAGATIQDDRSSFLLHASDRLGDGAASLRWSDGSLDEERRLDDRALPEWLPRVRYLSQQFVDRLCSHEGVDGELLEEIEAVVFQSIPDAERLEATDFAELRGIRLGEVHEAREGLFERIQTLAEQTAAEETKKGALPALVTREKECTQKIEKLEKDLRLLLPKGKKEEAQQLEKVQAALVLKQKELQAANLRQVKVGRLSEAFNRKRRDWEREFEELKIAYSDCGILEDAWERLRPMMPNDSDDVFAKASGDAQRIQEEVKNGRADKPKKPEDLSTWSLVDLQAEHKRLTDAIGVEQNRVKKHTDTTKLLEQKKQELDKLKKQIADARASDARKKRLIDERRTAYADVFSLFSREERVLEELYGPLMQRVSSGRGLAGLSFQVRRRVDLEGWAKQGEDLLDLRKHGDFQGQGALHRAASRELLPAWQSGDATQVGEAMEAFLGAHMRTLAQSRANDVSFQEMGLWLFSVEHVSIRYSITYNDMDLARLSPGTRGVVLLMLYLEIDQWDRRPLIVDQPEENLDPQSVYAQLVGYFRSAKQRRQIILVTHNPNLVVNADADQVIVANAERIGAGLPAIRYTSGGLEDARTRMDVCTILEGGARAFREREQRYAFPDDPRVDT